MVNLDHLRRIANTPLPWFVIMALFAGLISRPVEDSNQSISSSHFQYRVSNSEGLFYLHTNLIDQLLNGGISQYTLSVDLGDNASIWAVSLDSSTVIANLDYIAKMNEALVLNPTTVPRWIDFEVTAQITDFSRLVPLATMLRSSGETVDWRRVSTAQYTASYTTDGDRRNASIVFKLLDIEGKAVSTITINHNESGYTAAILHGATQRDLTEYQQDVVEQRVEFALQPENPNYNTLPLVEKGEG